MADAIRQVEYFYVQVSQKAGEAAKALDALKNAGVNLLVLRAGQHPLREVTLALKRYTQGGVRPAGFVFNDVVRLAGRYGYGYGYHYQYDYKKRKAS